MMTGEVRLDAQITEAAAGSTVSESTRSVEEFYRRVGRRITQARRARGLTQADLAAVIGLSRSSVGNLEAGTQRPQFHVLVEIARALGTDSAGLLGETTTVLAGAPSREILDTAAVAALARRTAVLGREIAQISATLAALGNPFVPDRASLSGGG